MIAAKSRDWLFATLGLEVESAASDDDGFGNRWNDDEGRGVGVSGFMEVQNALSNCLLRGVDGSSRRG